MSEKHENPPAFPVADSAENRRMTSSPNAMVELAPVRVRGQCSTCPFGDEDGTSDAAEQAINLGCVPSGFEIMGFKKRTGLNWGCHSAEPGEERVCAGFIRTCKEMGIEYRGAGTLPYDDWYHNGEPAALRALSQDERAE